MWDYESAIVSLGALLLALHLICQESREAVLQIHLSVHKPLDILLLMIYHSHIT
jgi:hypothetical protein